MSYKVKLNSFEGPFDLLVYLIENAEMDIYDIQISEITKQYMEYVKMLKVINVAVFSEFMVLAAELIAIKSKMLLPRTDPDEGYVIEEDPRSDLVERILEYKKFKSASEYLAKQEEMMQNIYDKPQEDVSEYINAEDEYLSLDIAQFVRAFENFLRKKEKIEEVKRRYTRVKRQKETIEAKIKYIQNAFTRLKRKTIHFKELIIDAKNKYDVILTFSSLLELAKERNVDLEQKKLYGDIVITRQEGELTSD